MVFSLSEAGWIRQDDDDEKNWMFGQRPIEIPPVVSKTHQRSFFSIFFLFSLLSLVSSQKSGFSLSRLRC